MLREVFDLIVRKHGEGDTSAWPEHERVPVLALEVAHIIANGGFSFLFYSNLIADPSYRSSLAAFEALGAETAADVFREALDLFVSGVAPLNLERRRLAVSNFPSADLNRIDSQFLSQINQIEERARAYVRAHAGSLQKSLLEA